MFLLIREVWRINVTKLLTNSVTFLAASLIVCTASGNLVYAQGAKLDSVIGATLDPNQVVAKGNAKEPPGSEPNLVIWEGTFSSALNKAKAENKLMFVYIYANWCGYCKQLSRTVFASPILADHLNTHYACLKLDGEEPSEGRPFVSRYNLRGYPNTVVIHPGDPMNYMVVTGALPASFYLIAVNKAASKVTADFAKQNSPDTKPNLDRQQTSDSKPILDNRPSQDGK
jgi:thiol:disulfide interchange protein